MQFTTEDEPLLDLPERVPEYASNPTFKRNPNMSISVGDKIPDVKLVKATAEGPQPVQSAEYFAGRRVALFSVPGAFTPTCSARHLPGFVEKSGELAAKGIDEIACTAVNDAFVLGAWNKSGGSDAITMLADGNGDFAAALGLEMDGSAFGMGKRGQRFSLVVNDGVVEHVNVEAPGDFNVSSAEYMLGQL
jgi:peroxiredoxin